MATYQYTGTNTGNIVQNKTQKKSKGPVRLGGTILHFFGVKNDNTGEHQVTCIQNLRNCSGDFRPTYL
jgi:hypothetical protein